MAHNSTVIKTDHNPVDGFLNQNLARKSSEPVTKAGIVGECTNVRVGAVCPKANSLFLSEFRASHEHKLPDFSSGSITKRKYVCFLSTSHETENERLKAV